MVNDKGTPTAFYTGIEPQTVCVATSTDDLMTWEQQSTPVIDGPPSGSEWTGFPSITGHPSADFRDPFVWREAGRWYLLIGTGLREKGGAALLYDSEDLRRWRYLGPALSGVIGSNCNMWECPVLLRFGRRCALLVCPHPEAKYVYWISGEWRDGSIHEEQRGQLDLGPYVYAPQCLYDPIQNRYLLWTWIKEGRNIEAQCSARWSGTLSLPKECSLDSNGSLALKPAGELTLLRREHRAVANEKLVPNSSDPFQGFVGDSFEIKAELSFHEPAICDLYLRTSSDRTEYTLLRYDSAEGTISVDCSRASLSPDVDRQIVSGNLHPDADGRVRFHIFLDRSVLELFLADSTCITQRIYPTRQDSLGLGFTVTKGSAIVHQLQVWKLASIWTS
jgi:beta-fructofuranosidase